MELEVSYRGEQREFVSHPTLLVLDDQEGTITIREPDGPGYSITVVASDFESCPDRGTRTTSRRTQRTHIEVQAR